MIIASFKPEHAALIALQNKQSEVIGAVDAQLLADCGVASTLIIDDEIIMCGGVVEQWQGRHVLWAMLSDKAGKYLYRATKFGRRLMETRDGRVEAIVRSDYPQAHRWVQLMGMKWHHHEERFLPGGIDADIYVRFC